MDKLFFQYCPKLIVFDEDARKVLLAKRKGEQDFDGVFSFIGGKIETTDGGILEGIAREKTEEIGPKARVEIAPMSVFTAYFQKNDGSSMILPHHICRYAGGEIQLSDEYSEYRWVDLDDIVDFAPKIDTIVPAIDRAKRFIGQLRDDDFVAI